MEWQLEHLMAINWSQQGKVFFSQRDLWSDRHFPFTHLINFIRHLQRLAALLVCLLTRAPVPLSKVAQLFPETLFTCRRSFPPTLMKVLYSWWTRGLHISPRLRALLCRVVVVLMRVGVDLWNCSLPEILLSALFLAVVWRMWQSGEVR